MSTRDLLDSTGVWRWLAAFLAGVVVAGAPTMSLLLTLPRHNDYEQLQQDLANARLDLVRLETIVTRNTEIIRGLQGEVYGPPDLPRGGGQSNSTG